ncbi:hypothetical protein ACA910_004805 [Epithemia clementina (nom. ined.)]
MTTTPIAKQQQPPPPDLVRSGTCSTEEETTLTISTSMSLSSSSNLSLLAGVVATADRNAIENDHDDHHHHRHIIHRNDHIHHNDNDNTVPRRRTHTSNGPSEKHVIQEVVTFSAPISSSSCSSLSSSLTPCRRSEKNQDHSSQKSAQGKENNSNDEDHGGETTVDANQHDRVPLLPKGKDLHNSPITATATTATTTWQEVTRPNRCGDKLHVMNDKNDERQVYAGRSSANEDDCHRRHAPRTTPPIRAASLLSPLRSRVVLVLDESHKRHSPSTTQPERTASLSSPLDSDVVAVDDENDQTAAEQPATSQTACTDQASQFSSNHCIAPQELEDRQPEHGLIVESPNTPDATLTLKLGQAHEEQEEDRILECKSPAVNSDDASQSVYALSLLDKAFDDDEDEEDEDETTQSSSSSDDDNDDEDDQPDSECNKKTVIQKRRVKALMDEYLDVSPELRDEREDGVGREQEEEESVDSEARCSTTNDSLASSSSSSSEVKMRTTKNEKEQEANPVSHAGRTKRINRCYRVNGEPKTGGHRMEQEEELGIQSFLDRENRVLSPALVIAAVPTRRQKTPQQHELIEEPQEKPQEKPPSRRVQRLFDSFLDDSAQHLPEIEDDGGDGVDPCSSSSLGHSKRSKKEVIVEGLTMLKSRSYSDEFLLDAPSRQLVSSCGMSSSEDILSPDDAVSRKWALVIHRVNTCPDFFTNAFVEEDDGDGEEENPGDDDDDGSKSFLIMEIPKVKKGAKATVKYPTHIECTPCDTQTKALSSYGQSVTDAAMGAMAAITCGASSGSAAAPPPVTPETGTADAKNEHDSTTRCRSSVMTPDTLAISAPSLPTAMMHPLKSVTTLATTTSAGDATFPATSAATPVVANNSNNNDNHATTFCSSQNAVPAHTSAMTRAVSSLSPTPETQEQGEGGRGLPWEPLWSVTQFLMEASSGNCAFGALGGGLEPQQ